MIINNHVHRRSIISPLSRSIIALEFLIVESLCAITNVVLSAIRLFIAFWTSSSVLVSIEEVASSRIIILEFASTALAIEISWICPCDNETSVADILVLYPSGRFSIILSTLAIFAAAYTSSSVASSLP